MKQHCAFQHDGILIGGGRGPRCGIKISQCWILYSCDCGPALLLSFSPDCLRSALCSRSLSLSIFVLSLHPHFLPRTHSSHFISREPPLIVWLQSLHAVTVVTGQVPFFCCSGCNFYNILDVIYRGGNRPPPCVVPILFESVDCITRHCVQCTVAIVSLHILPLLEYLPRSPLRAGLSVRASCVTCWPFCHFSFLVLLLEALLEDRKVIREERCLFPPTCVFLSVPLCCTSWQMICAPCPISL